MNDIKLEIFDPNKTYKGQKGFDCNNSMINDFVYKSLKKKVKDHLTRAYVLLQDKRFVGFYTLDTFAITRDDFELKNKPRRLPPMVPLIKLSMLGIDKSLQGQGLGKRLLGDVFKRVYEISKLVGCKGIYLLAEEKAIPFYESLGFVALKDDKPLPMFLNIETIMETFEQKIIRNPLP